MSFLRRVRHNLVMDGERKKHGFFMLAEMVLIVGGITIALQLDTWQSNLDNEKAELVLLNQLKEEFELVKIKLVKEKEGFDELSPVYTVLYKLCGEKDIPLTKLELATLCANIGKSRFAIDLSVLDEARNTGRLADISNDELRILLYGWNDGLDWVESEVQYYNLYTKDLNDYIFKYLPFRDYDDNLFPDKGLGISKNCRNPNRIFDELYFENQIGVAFYLNERILGAYNEKLTQPTALILSMIKIELEVKQSHELP